LRRFQVVPWLNLAEAVETRRSRPHRIVDVAVNDRGLLESLRAYDIRRRRRRLSRRDRRTGTREQDRNKDASLVHVGNMPTPRGR
jgi:hypothetical protein